VAVVGFGSRGQNHISGLSKLKGVRLAGLCDVDTTILGKEQQKWKDKGVDVKGYTDMRKLLESKEVDVISIATPNHWHSLASIWAIQAGKDVYVEKPVSHNVWEGRKVVEAARKHGKIVQTGTQSRSTQALAECFVAEGRESREDEAGPRPLLQVTAEHRESGRPATGASGSRLRPVVRSGSGEADHAQTIPLRLALGLGHRQWRSGQPGHPPNGHRALGLGLQ